MKEESPYSFRHSKPAKLPLRGKLLDIQPVHSRSQCRWITLEQDGTLSFFNAQVKEAGDLEFKRLRGALQIDISRLDQDKTIQLHVSPDQRFCAVVERYGEVGHVIDLTTGQLTMPLKRGNYYPSISSFPIAFIKHKGRTLLIHCTDWNRLDISDPSTGELITVRESPDYSKDERPPHDLDYFHCSLAVSPDGKWIADNGWIWHPHGEVRTWSLEKWIDENVWESEDGLSIRKFALRNYIWDIGLCWIDRNRLAIWGKGEVGFEPKRGVGIYDVKTGLELQFIQKPLIEPSRPASYSTGKWGWLVFDKYLFAISYVSGTGVWDIQTGDRIFHKKNMRPDRYHRGAQRFLTLKEDGMVVVSRFVQKSG
ncbi:MAG: hypothetical protein KF784_15845 [Fimbriimonadaceae bacterium]|nr:hypothetical protein [Fimbriimonadaceae bacterium]